MNNVLPQSEKVRSLLVKLRQKGPSAAPQQGADLAENGASMEQGIRENLYEENAQVLGNEVDRPLKKIKLKPLNIQPLG